jgi:hypothetical protein
MKSKEEIEQLANDYWEGCDNCEENDKYFFIKGFGCAYRQMQQDMANKKYTEQDMIKFAFDTYYQEDMAKKYTEEDVIHLMFNATKWDTFKEGEVGYDMSLSEYIQHCLHKLNKQD